MNDPIWTIATLVAMPIFLLVALALMLLGVAAALGYRQDKFEYAHRAERADERRTKAEAYTKEAKQRVLADRASSGGADAGYDMDPESISDYDIREMYEDETDGNYFDDMQGRITDDKPDTEDRNWAIALPLVGLVVVGAVAWSMYPFGAQYHQWRVVQGPVAAVGGEKLSGGENSTYLSWVFDVNGKKYVCEEARCGSVDVGEIVKLRCKPTYHRVGSETNYCSFVSVKAG